MAESLGTAGIQVCSPQCCHALVACVCPRRASGCNSPNQVRHPVAHRPQPSPRETWRLTLAGMHRSFRHHRLLPLLACLAVVLMLVAPLISRWSQAQSAEPMCMSAPALSAESSLHAGHRTRPPGIATHAHSDAATATQHAGSHEAATHGEACDYCVLAARLLLLLIVALLCLLQLRPTPAPAYTQASAGPVFRWAALGARGPPLPA